MRAVTIDTNVAHRADLIEAAQRSGFEVSVVSVTDRELSSSDIRPSVNSQVPEMLILDEGQLDHAVVPSEEESALLTQTLRIICNGSFPGLDSYDHFSPGQRRQLRDAIILLAHVRERRHIFVSDDRKAFLREGRREKLEHLLSTRIMTSSEFLSLLAT